MNEVEQIQKASFKDIFSYLLKETANSIAQGGLTFNFEPIVNNGKKFEFEQTRLKIKVPRFKLNSGESLVVSHDTRPLLQKAEVAIRMLQQEMAKNQQALQEINHPNMQHPQMMQESGPGIQHEFVGPPERQM